MMPGNRRLEVVDHLCGTRWPRPGHVLRFADIWSVPEIALGVVPAIRIDRCDPKPGYQEHDPVTGEIRERVDLITSPKPERRSARQKEGNIGAEGGGHVDELTGAQPHSPRVR